MKRIALSLLLVAFLLTSSQRCIQAQDRPKFDYGTVMVLNNGARLIVLPTDSTDTVSINVFFSVGRGDERNNPGINALLCRTWGNASGFRSAALLQGDINRTGSVGTEYSEDWVEIWGVSSNAPGEVHKSLQTVIVNLVGNPLFTAESILEARQSQERTALFEKDDLVDSAIEALRGRAFGGSDYGISAIGFPEKLTLVRPETLSAYYNRYFRPNRCVVVIAGKVDPDEMRRKVEASFGAGDFNTAPPAPVVPTMRVRPIPVGLRDINVGRTAPATVLAIGWLAPGTATQADESENRHTYATLTLLDTVIGGGKTARLFHELRDVNPVGYDVRTTLLPGRGSSLWCAYVVGNSDPETYRTALMDQIMAIAEGKRPITEAELARARTYLKARHLQNEQRIRDRAFGAGWAEIMGMGATFDIDYAKYLDAVTVEEVNRMAQSLFNANTATVLSRLPAPPEKTE